MTVRAGARAITTVLVVAGLLGACGDDDARSAGAACDALADPAVLSPDATGAGDALERAANQAPPEVRPALDRLAGAADEIARLDPAAPGASVRLAEILGEPAVLSAQNTVRDWWETACGQ